MFDFSHLVQEINDFFEQPWVKEGIQAIIRVFGKISLWFKTQFGPSLIDILKSGGRMTILALEKVLEGLKRIVK